MPLQVYTARLPHHRCPDCGEALLSFEEARALREAAQAHQLEIELLQAVVAAEAEGKPFEAVADLVRGVRGREGLGNGDTEHGIWTAGMIQGLIHDIPTCQDLVSRIVADAESIIRGRLASKLA